MKKFYELSADTADIIEKQQKTSLVTAAASLVAWGALAVVLVLADVVKPEDLIAETIEAAE